MYYMFLKADRFPFYKAVWTVCCLLLLNLSIAQNLVPNPGFEERLSEPIYGPSGVNKSPHWFRLGGTSDFFHATYDAPNAVPSNFRGTQAPAEGLGYAGIIATINWEFIAVKLIEPLIEDQIYDLSFAVNLSEQSRHGIDGLGAILLKDEPNEKELKLYNYTLRNQFGRVLTDTANWTIIAGQFRAEGEEQYLLIGSLPDDKPITFSDVLMDGLAPWAYYFIDNVYLAPCPKPVIQKIALDTSICDGTQLLLSGQVQAKSHRWQHGGVRPTRVITEPGLYILDNHYDCEVQQQIFRVHFSDCDCQIKLPTLYHEADRFFIQVSPIVLSYDLSMYGGHGQALWETDEAFEDPLPDVPVVSGPYFWRADLTCLGPDDKTFKRLVSGKMIIQN